MQVDLKRRTVRFARNKEDIARKVPLTWDLLGDRIFSNHNNSKKFMKVGLERRPATVAPLFIVALYYQFN